jgi:hypothetical protein
MMAFKFRISTEKNWGKVLPASLTDDVLTLLRIHEGHSTIRWWREKWFTK